ncbi:hypothetical protein R3P38DRAFT_2858888 [Favolaschia claudopus]|uniref:Ricin B lectin domain-containing protein n=1 Tax=Favolaschia claudopus TaxID=2862362 RepID=A0AAW0DM34_9AGAR
MLPTSLVLLSVGLLSTFVTATPAPRASCNPNFEGAGVSIIDNSVEWGVSPPVAGTVLSHILGGFPPNATAEWHVQQTGAFPTTYIVKEINHNDLVVGIGADGLLVLEEIDSSKPTQIWQISCDSCSSGASSTPRGGEFASGCKIVSDANGSCVEVQHGGSHVTTAQCNPIVAQSWEFWTATA